MGTAVAEQVAEKLGYECLSRSVLLEASEQFDIPQVDLSEALQNAPSLLERLGHRKQSYVAYVRCALARHVLRDNIVYHGLAGHVLLKNVAHVLKVRIMASMELRVSIITEQENMNPVDAAAWIAKVDKGRQKWTKSLYHTDPNDPTVYDLLLNIPRFSVEDAAELICEAARMKQFATTKDSQRAMEDLALACEVKARLVEEYPDVGVTSRNGNVLVHVHSGERTGRKLRGNVEALCASIEGISNIEVHVDVSLPENAV